MIRIGSMVVAMTTLFASLASAQDVNKGKDVYTAQKCSICHSVAGVGNKKGALDGIGGKLSAADIRAWLTDAPAMAAKVKAERKPAMKSVTLAKDDLDALVAYLQSLK